MPLSDDVALLLNPFLDDVPILNPCYGDSYAWNRLYKIYGKEIVLKERERQENNKCRIRLEY